MSAPQVIFVPVQAQNNGQPLHVNVAGPEQVHKIVQNSQHGNGSNGHANTTNGAHRTNDPTFVKQITSDPSILYSFINWENPGRTFASFITVISLIISTRYFSPLQWILKILCTILGATSVVEAVGRVATKDGVMNRVRPKSYYRPSKQTYSRLFSEIEQAVDMSLVKLQRIIFMEDLQGGIIGFALTFVAYWLVQVVPPFWLAIATTLLTYTLGPVLTGPHSSSLKPAIENKARDLKNQAVDTASSAGNHTVNKTQELSSRAMDTASSAGSHTVNKTQELGSRAQDTAPYATNVAAAKAHSIQDQTHDLATQATDRINNYARGGTGTQGGFNSATAPPNALGTDANDMSRDRRVQVHPVETTHTAI